MPRPSAPPRRANVRADGLRLRQVLTNLAGNAVKFTDAGGVCIAVERASGGEARFSVIDTGPGVPADRRTAIFDSFEQGDGSHARRFEGAGLGLTISRELVRRMGGELTLADNPGGGSIFAFAARLPECAAVEPACAVEARAHALSGTRALIIAHSPFEAPAIAARLTEAGVRVERADGLGSGLAALSGAPAPDLVIVDCALGPEATNRLAQAARAAGVRRSLVLFSPFERRAFGQTALKGFDGWLVKPVRARSLFERAASDSPPASAPAARPSPGSAPARRALVAEDNDINALITQKALRRLGFEVVRALDGEEALRLASPIAPLESRPFDVILMDLKMPGIDGYEATRRLRRLEASCGWSPTPIVALTANVLDESRRASMPAGFDAFLVKPIEFRALAGAVERVCAAGAAPWRERLRAS